MSNDRNCQCDQGRGACSTEFQYAVKVVCGAVDGNEPCSSTPVAPGRYWTAINIHNPNKCGDAHFRWKVAVAAPLGRPPLVTGFQRPLVLGPDEALEIDCDHIIRTLPLPERGFVKGYVVIESDIELDVVAVYSGTQGSNSGLSSFHTERVHPRCVPVCEDLVLPLHTGIADWQTVAPTPGPLGPVALVNPFPWIAPPFGAAWVSQASTDGSDASAGIRYFDLCFNLCSGFTVPAPFQIQVLVDNSANVFLNNNLIVSVPSPGFTAPTTATVDPNFLRAGRNCFRIEATNNGGPTGFALAGILRVNRGKCPCSSPLMASISNGPATLEEQDIASPDEP
jgi:hypothetical protein